MKVAEQQWIFGYGSLLCPKSRRRTTPWLEHGVATLRGYQRSWCAKIPEAGATVLGIVRNRDATCNGVMLCVTDEAVGRLDDRERASVYARHRLDPGDVDFSAPPSRDRALKAWGYICVTPHTPDVVTPIVQSYVDVVLGGCLEVSVAFAEQFVRTTGGWQHHWINDRQAPRYVRAVRNPTLEQRVDALLARMLPAAFSARH